MNDDTNQLIVRAQAGNPAALEQLITKYQDQVYNLAMRMLAHPQDAQDASQEILILVVTKLSTFKGDSAFSTWVYRVATNYLLSARKKLDRFAGMTFEIFAQDLASGLVSDPPPAADDVVELNELRISCTMAMLLCLTPSKRIAYVLGDVLELEQGEACEILGVGKEAYRKTLSRARAEIIAFTTRNCGLVSQQAKCSCPKRLPAAKAMKRIDTGVYAKPDSPSYVDAVARVAGVVEELKTLKLQSAISPFRSPKEFGAQIAGIVNAP